MLLEASGQAAGPADSAFQKTELQIRKALRHAAEKQVACEEMMALGEMAEVVRNEIGR